MYGQDSGFLVEDGRGCTMSDTAKKLSDHKRVIIAVVVLLGGIGTSFAVAAAWGAVLGAFCILCGLGAAIVIIA